MTKVTETKEATLSLNLSTEEGLLLLKLLKSSSDDPRIHGLIGTCFWFHNYNKTEEQVIRDTWTSIEQKMQKSIEQNLEGDEIGSG
tara:strand:+ start:152 stop:409 length:258 start_codon:yes stop_codon:yes gene_type:complete